jgi:hypothetical protein
MPTTASNGHQAREVARRSTSSQVARSFVASLLRKTTWGKQVQPATFHTIAPDATHQQIVILTEGKDLETWMPARNLTAAVARMPARQTCQVFKAWKVSVPRDLPDFPPVRHRRSDP